MKTLEAAARHLEMAELELEAAEVTADAGRIGVAVGHGVLAIAGAQLLRARRQARFDQRAERLFGKLEQMATRIFPGNGYMGEIITPEATVNDHAVTRSSGYIAVRGLGVLTEESALDLGANLIAAANPEPAALEAALAKAREPYNGPEVPGPATPPENLSGDTPDAAGTTPGDPAATGGGPGS